MTRENHYREKCPHRARGVLELDRLVGGVFAEIEERLARQDVVHILELGCGYGTALLELGARYGRRVELHGINRVHGDGNPEILLRNATERRLTGDDVMMPTIVYGDVADGLPFDADYVDLVCSQVAWLYFGNKIGVLQEVIRVLKPDGIAKIDADEVRPGLPPEYGRLVEIWEDGKLVPFGDYLRRFGMGLVPAPEGEYLRFGKTQAFGQDLTRVFEIDVSCVYKHWDGIKCVYSCAG
ncbi:MAG: class I SAM-dependent methyltransferase [Casimicrobiaceae bacterium]